MEKAESEIKSGQTVMIDNVQFTLRLDVSSKKWYGSIGTTAITKPFDTVEECLEYIKTPRWDAIMALACIAAEYAVDITNKK